MFKNESGTMTGTYCSIHGQPSPESEFPIVGFVNDELIAFVTSWGKHCSMTSWSGRFFQSEDGKPSIRTSWTLVRKFADRAHLQENEYWESFITYAGTYFLCEQFE